MEEDLEKMVRKVKSEGTRLMFGRSDKDMELHVSIEGNEVYMALNPNTCLGCDERYRRDLSQVLPILKLERKSVNVLGPCLYIGPGGCGLIMKRFRNELIRAGADDVTYNGKDAFSR